MKKNKSFITICLLVFFLSCFFNNAQTEDRQGERQKIDFLRKIAKASREISYSASIHKEYFYNPDSVGVFEKRVVKIDENNMLQQFTFPESMSDVITIQKGDIYYHKQVDSDIVDVSVSSGETNVGAEISDDVYLLKRNYDFIFLRTEKFGDYVTDVVKVVSKYRDRDWLQMWVGAENGFIFRLERYDSNDIKIYQEYVENIVLNPEIDTKLFEISKENTASTSRRSDRAYFNNLADLRAIWKKTVLVPKFIPSGFILDRISTFEGPTSTGDRSKYIQLHYTDGLSRISLFQRVAKGEKQDMGVGIRFYDNRRIIRISETRNNVSLTLFSDLPEEMLLDLFKTLNRNDEEECESN
ncbi:MAG: hypothetical protein GY863_21860 [bacterium]|nr:hypothetical protein [bacterium]